MATQPGAYQTANFAYQGERQHVYQEVVFFVPPPVPKYTLMVMPNGWIRYVFNKDYTP